MPWPVGVRRGCDLWARGECLSLLVRGEDVACGRAVNVATAKGGDCSEQGGKLQLVLLREPLDGGGGLRALELQQLEQAVKASGGCE